MFRQEVVHVTVPATTANLGPGYDCFGMALALHDEIEVQVRDGGLDVDVAGEGASTVVRDDTNLVVSAMNAAFDRLGGRPAGLRVRCTNRVPHGRGLGSSSAAIVGGVAAARGLATNGDEQFDDDAMLALATELEGHPDNVAAAVHGGVTIAYVDGDGVHALRVTPHADLLPVVVIPDTELRTAEARGALPKTVPHAEAALNSARAALLSHALVDRLDLLMVATDDLLHQQYRRAVMPQSLHLVDELRASGIPAVVSGAGPTVLALTTRDSAAAVASDVTRRVAPQWRTEVLDIDNAGVTTLVP